MRRRGDNWGEKTGNTFFTDLPVTKGIIIAWLAVFLAEIFTNGQVDRLLVFYPLMLPNIITGVITYPFVLGVGNIFGLLINGLVFYWFGGSLERSWGARRLLLFLLVANLVSALLWEVGLLLFTHGFGVVSNPWFMLSSVIVAWAWLNPEATVLFWFVLPLKAKWIGWIDILSLYLLMPLGLVPGFLIPLMGFFALGGVGVALLYVRWEHHWGWIPRRPKERVARVPRPRRRLIVIDRLLAPLREWQRRRNIARLRRTWKMDA